SVITRPPTPANYLLSLPDALPTSHTPLAVTYSIPANAGGDVMTSAGADIPGCLASWFAIADGAPGAGLSSSISPGSSVGLGQARSEEHTSELQSRGQLVCSVPFEK